MKITELKKLVKSGESQTLEFKNSTGSLSSGMQTISAFLNSDLGGSVIFGVKDNGELIGQTVTDKTSKEIAIELNKIEPNARIDVTYITLKDSKKIIVLTVNPGNKGPYTYDGRAFVRNQSTSRRMSHEEYVYLYNRRHPTLWESLTTNNCEIKDLDKNRIEEVVRLAIIAQRLPASAASLSVLDILNKLNLIVDNQLTNAAVILFCKSETKQFIQSNVKLARFKGIDKREFLDNKYFVANAFDLFDKASDFLYFTLPVAAHIEEGKSERVETPEIPYKVTREALTNALVHRDYSNAGGSLAVAVYDDRLNITNFGALPQGVNIKQLSKQHASVLRNPLIANVFYLCGKIEKWGRGTLDMIEDCKQSGNPIPKFEEIGGSFSVTLPFKKAIRDVTIKPADLGKLTLRQSKIMKTLKYGPLKTQEIIEKGNLNLVTRVIQIELAKLERMGLVASEGKTKNKIWFLK